MLWRLFILALVTITSGFNIVCYYTNWSQYRPAPWRFVPQNVDPQLCTHISYAFCKPVGVELSVLEWNDDVMISNVIELKRQNPKLKVLVAIGGWNMQTIPFLTLSSNEHNRDLFAKNTVKFVREKNFDGFELDWEYPNASLKENFASLVKKLRTVFEDDARTTRRPRLELGVAVAAGKRHIDAGLDVPEVSKYADFVNIMTYDLHGPWDPVVGFNSPLYAHPDETGDERYLNVDWAARYFVSLGAPKEKLNVGVASYARTFTLRDPRVSDVLSPHSGEGQAGQFTRLAGILSYYEVCKVISDGGRVVQVQSQGNAYVLKGDQWIGYDDVASATRKACYVRQNGFGGNIFWALDFDDFTNNACGQGAYPLLKAVNNGLFLNSGCQGLALQTTSRPRPISTSQPGMTPGPTPFNPLATHPAATYPATAYPGATYPATPYSEEQTTAHGAPRIKSGLNVVCYYTNWAQFRSTPWTFLPENVNPKLCTHIVYAFCKTIGVEIAALEWSDADLYSRIIKLKNGNPDLMVLLGIGGLQADFNSFLTLSDSPSNREMFANNAVKFLRQKNFDGLELDWEYPIASEREQFTKLIEKLREVFETDARDTGKTRLELGVATAAGKTTIDNGLDIALVSQAADFLNVMTYDLHGKWESFTGFNSPLYAHPREKGYSRYLNMDWVAKYYVSKGAREEKLNLGIATYGRSFTLNDPSIHDVISPAYTDWETGEFTRQRGIMGYFEVCDVINSGGKVVQIKSQGNPYVVKDKLWVGYDDVASVAEKACYVRQHGYGGVVFWPLDYDDFRNGSCNEGHFPLLTAVNKGLFTDMKCAPKPEDNSVASHHFVWRLLWLETLLVVSSVVGELSSD